MLFISLIIFSFLNADKYIFDRFHLIFICFVFSFELVKRSVDFKSRGVKLFPGKDNNNKLSVCEFTLCYSIIVNLWYAFYWIFYFMLFSIFVLCCWCGSCFCFNSFFFIAWFEHRSLLMLVAWTVSFVIFKPAACVCVNSIAWCSSIGIGTVQPWTRSLKKNRLKSRDFFYWSSR